jgi:hypothetical protein
VDVQPESFDELVVVDCDRGTVDTAAARIEALPRKVARSLGRSIRRALLPTVLSTVATSEATLVHTSAVTALTDLDAPARFDAPLQLPTAAASSAGSTAAGVSVAGTTTAAAAGVELPEHCSSSTDSSSSESAESPKAAAASTAAVVAVAAAVPRASKAALLHHSAADRTVTSSSSTNSSSSSSSSGWLAAQHTLRMDFVRAMADLLFGYSDCLFFVDPDRPIFNAERFLQEYVREEGVPFLSRVVDTLAFKFLLENQVLAHLHSCRIHVYKCADLEVDCCYMHSAHSRSTVVYFVVSTLNSL